MYLRSHVAETARLFMLMRGRNSTGFGSPRPIDSHRNRSNIVLTRAANGLTTAARGRPSSQTWDPAEVDLRPSRQEVRQM
jgi:hypothetical protein